MPPTPPAHNREITADLPPALARPITRRGLSLGALAGLEALLAAVTGPAAPRAAAAASAELDERTRVAHLLRRAGFGAGPQELDAAAQQGYQATLERLINYDLTPDDFEARLQALNAGLEMDQQADMQRWWLLRMTLTQRPFQEKMTLFWHGFLTSGFAKAGGKRAPTLMQQNQFLREHALDDFRTILQGVTVDPAMLLWLDGAGSRKKQANENYSRELMELFTIGAGNYTETDVREGARAFTGWNLDKESYQAVFDPKQHDDGVKTYLGKTGRWNAADIVNILVEHPKTGWRLARKLWTFFAYSSPDDDTIRPMVEAYYSQGFSVRAMAAALFLSPAFVSPQAYRARVKSPLEFMVGALRGLEVQTAGKFMQATAQRMGQAIFNPPNVAGWPGGTSWLNSGAWLERLNFINQIVTSRQDKNPTQPIDFVALMDARGLHQPAAMLDYLLANLVDGNVSEASRAVLLEYLTDSGKRPFGGSFTRDAKYADERIRGVVYLIMAMPEYHLN